VRLIKFGIIVSEQRALKHLSVEKMLQVWFHCGMGSEVIKTL